jgi:5'-methylthioadenosine phosphorylase
MREEIVPGHLVVPDQFIDRTVARKNTFFGEGVVAHVPFATPICINLAGHLATAARTDKTNEVHVGGSYVCIEGPAFSTCAESLLYRSWDVSVIGMTSLPEAKLAREAELCYATLALATDYDCWHQGHESVTVEVVMNTMKANVERARQTIRAAAKVLGEAERACTCEHALAHAVMTAPESIPPKARVRLGLLLEKYLPATKAVRKPATKTIKSVKTTKTVRRVMG